MWGRIESSRWRLVGRKEIVLFPGRILRLIRSRSDVRGILRRFVAIKDVCITVMGGEYVLMANASVVDSSRGIIARLLYDNSHFG